MNLRELSIATFNLYNLNEPGLPLYTRQGRLDRRASTTARSPGRRASCSIAEIGHLRLPGAVASRPRSRGRSKRAGLDATSTTCWCPPDANGTQIVCAAIVRKGLLTGAPDWISEFPGKFVLPSSSGDDPQTPVIDVQDHAAFRGRSLHFTMQAARGRAGRPRLRLPLQVEGAQPRSSTSPGFTPIRPTYSQAHHSDSGAALSTIRRTAEAAALRFLLTEQMKGNDTAVIVLGDINDGQQSNTANILTEQPRYLVGDSVGGGDVGALHRADAAGVSRHARRLLHPHPPGHPRIARPHPGQRAVLRQQQASGSGCSTAWPSTTIISTSTTTRQTARTTTGSSVRSSSTSRFGRSEQGAVAARRRRRLGLQERFSAVSGAQRTAQGVRPDSSAIDNASMSPPTRSPP